MTLSEHAIHNEVGLQVFRQGLKIGTIRLTSDGTSLHTYGAEVRPPRLPPIHYHIQKHYCKFEKQH